MSFLTCFTEVERFIEVNTQKLAENKYLCPLSGKKFKGPDFVRKHIFNKHSDKVDTVREEVFIVLTIFVLSFICVELVVTSVSWMQGYLLSRTQ